MFGEIGDMLDDIGTLVTVERQTKTGSTNLDYGGGSVTWTTHLTAKMSIQSLSGQEIVSADRRGIIASLIAYSNIIDVTEKDRMLLGGIYYQITYVEDVALTADHMEIYLNRADNYGSQSN